MILGPLFHRRWFSREPLDEGFVKRVIESAVTGAKPDRPGVKKKGEVPI